MQHKHLNRVFFLVDIEDKEKGFMHKIISNVGYTLNNINKSEISFPCVCFFPFVLTKLWNQDIISSFLCSDY